MKQQYITIDFQSNLGDMRIVLDLILYCSNATYSPGTDMMVDCLSGSLIISDTLVCCKLLVKSGSDIRLITSCRHRQNQKCKFS